MTDIRTVVLPLVRTQKYSGFFMEDIRAALDDEAYAVFQKWFDGQTGAIHFDGRLLVYASDWHRFVNGYAVYD